MAENNSIDNLSRQDLLTVLDGFIEQTRQIKEIKDKYHSRYDDIAHELLLAEYRKPKNFVMAYFLAQFYALIYALKDGNVYKLIGCMAGFVGDYSLIMLLPRFIIRLFTGLAPESINSVFLAPAPLIPFGIIGYLIGRKKYMQHWMVIKKGNYDSEIYAAVDSDQQIIDYKNKHTSLVNDATYQQYRSLIPQNFTLGDIVGIYQVLLDYRADNFKEAVNAWRQEQHNKQVENKMDENTKKISQMDAKLNRVTDLAERQAEAKKAKRVPIVSGILDYMDSLDEREKKEAAKRADEANKAIIKKFK
jgi:hypothetical protein